MLNMSESDLRFLVETVATSRRDHDHIVNLIRDKEDLLEPMLEDPKLTERLLIGIKTHKNGPGAQPTIVSHFD